MTPLTNAIIIPFVVAIQIRVVVIVTLCKLFFHWLPSQGDLKVSGCGSSVVRELVIKVLFPAVFATFTCAYAS
jgi:hypothetical protein